MAGGAPVCLLPNVGSVPPPQPGIKLPSIPKAIDLPSALNAITQLTFVVNQLSGAAPSININNVYPNTAQAQALPIILSNNAGVGPNLPSAGGGASSGGGKNKNKKGNWQEIDRTVERVKIVNPDDDSQFVIFDRINSLTFQNAVTGDFLHWERQS